MTCKKKILVAPLNWGLGHATRCIPIINALQQANFEPILASDGAALALLKKEFPNLKHYTLPAYNIKYAKNALFFKLKLILQAPKIIKAVKQEKKIVAKIVEKEQLSGIISDNKFGVRSSKIPSVYVTHQVKVLSGFTTWITSKVHQKIINNFTECWIPDINTEANFSGKMSASTLKIPKRYLGALSRFNFKKEEKKYEVCIVLSGPEPQRTLLENKLLKSFKNYPKKILLVRGLVEETHKTSEVNNIKIVNFLTSRVLEKAINSSEIIIARSGYTTVLDLAKLGKKAFFIPTPNQTEQLYLAKRLEALKVAPYCLQNNFNLNELEQIDSYNSFEKAANKAALNLFSLF